MGVFENEFDPLEEAEEGDCHGQGSSSEAEYEEEQPADVATKRGNCAVRGPEAVVPSVDQASSPPDNNACGRQRNEEKQILTT